MSMMRTTCALLAAALASAGSFNFSSTLGDHMVLQRDATNPPALVYGFGSPGLTVTTTFNGQKLQTQVDGTGVFRQPLPATPMGGPYVITCSQQDGQTIALQDVMFGDVYLIGGQSNAQFALQQVFNAEEECATAAQYPNFRLFTVGQGTFSTSPLRDLATIEQGWSVSSISAACGAGNFTFFSAYGFLFARNVAQMTGMGTNAVIGLISNNWGGTPVQAWSSPDALATCPPVPQPPYPSPNPSAVTNSTLYNAMLYPYILGPTAVKGMTWYQGESNAPPFTYVPGWYACGFQAFIIDMRTKLSNPNMYFGFILLAPFTSVAADGYAHIRAEQLAALSALPNVGMGSAIDGGDPQGPWGAYHPRNKQQLSARLAASAADLVYGAQVPWRGPQLTGATGAVNGATLTVTLTFDPSTLAGGGLQLNASTPPCPVGQGVPAPLCASFAIHSRATTGPQPADTYTAVSGYTLINGQVLSSGNYTLAQAVAVCNSIGDACQGFTSQSDLSGGQSAPVAFRSMSDFGGAGGWTSWVPAGPRGYVTLVPTATLSADQQSVILTAQNPNPALPLTPAAVSYAYASWPIAPLYNLAGLPALPFFHNITQ